MRIGIIGAMPQEIDRIRTGMQSEEQHRIAGRTYHVGNYAGIETVLVFSRWGKVAAAMTATAMIERLGVEAILFTGVAGGVAKEIHVGDIVVATDLLQHDFDVSKTGMAMRFEIPLLGISTFQVRPELIAPAQRACERYLAQRGADADHPEKSPVERSPRVHLGTIASGDQFIAAHVLSDEQQRRQRLLSQMNVFSSPRFYVWTKPWSAGTSLVQDKKTVGSALVTLPLNWDQPVAGTSILVPSPLMSIREVQGPDEVRPAGLYDRRTRRFLERTGPVKSWLAFQLPAGALPLETKSALITFKVQGPLRRLELSTVIDKRRRSLKVWENPVGTLQFEITDPEALKLDPKGRLLLRVDVGDQAEGKQSDGKSNSTDPAAYWQFEDVSVQISGKIAAPSN